MGGAQLEFPGSQQAHARARIQRKRPGTSSEYERGRARGDVRLRLRGDSKRNPELPNRDVRPKELPRGMIECGTRDRSGVRLGEQRNFAVQRIEGEIRRTRRRRGAWVDRCRHRSVNCKGRETTHEKAQILDLVAAGSTPAGTPDNRRALGGSRLV